MGGDSTRFKSVRSVRVFMGSTAAGGTANFYGLVPAFEECKDEVSCTFIVLSSLHFCVGERAFAGIVQLLATNVGSSGDGLSPKSNVKLALSASSTRLSPELWASGGVSLHRVDIAEQVFR